MHRFFLLGLTRKIINHTKNRYWTLYIRYNLFCRILYFQGNRLFSMFSQCFRKISYRENSFLQFSTRLMHFFSKKSDIRLFLLMDIANKCSHIKKALHTYKSKKIQVTYVLTIYIHTSHYSKMQKDGKAKYILLWNHRRTLGNKNENALWVSFWENPLLVEETETHYGKKVYS